MKKTILYILIFFPFLLFSQRKEEHESMCDHLLIEGKLAYFRPNSSAFREIYAPAWLNSQLELTIPIWGYAHSLNIYGSVNYLKNSGRSIGGDNKTKVQILPISLGLKYRACIKQSGNRIDFYAAGGMRYFFVWIKNYDPFVKQKVDKNGLGWVAEAGALFFLTKQLCLDLFADYSSKTFSFSSTDPLVTGHKLDVGGFSAGAGLGMQF